MDLRLGPPRGAQLEDGVAARGEQRQRRAECGVGDPRMGAHALLHRIQELGATLVGVSGRERHLSREQSHRVVPAVGAYQREQAARDERGSHQQHARHGHLSRHDDCSGARRLPAGRPGRRAAPLRKGFDEVDAPRVNGREETARNTRGQRQPDGEQQHAGVDRDGVQAGKIRGKQRWQRAVQRGRQCKASGASGRADDRAFDEQLPPESSGAGAERGSNGQLAASGRSARELQARDVRRGGGEQQAACNEQQAHGRTHLGGERVERPGDRHIDGPSGAEQRERHRPGIGSGAGARDPFRGGLRRRHSGSQPRQREKDGSAPHTLFIDDGRNRPGDPAARFAVGKGKVSRHDADDGVRPAVEPDRAADDDGASAAALLPQSERENDDGALPGGALIGREQPPEQRAGVQHGEEAGGRQDDVEPLGVPLPGERRARISPPASERFDRRGTAAPGKVRAVADGSSDARGASLPRFRHPYESLRIRPGQRPQKHPVRHAEERRGHADPERHRHDRDQRVTGFAFQQARSVAHIVKDAREERARRWRRFDGRRPARPAPKRSRVDAPGCNQGFDLAPRLFVRAALGARGLVGRGRVLTQFFDDIVVECLPGGGQELSDKAAPLRHGGCARLDRAPERRSAKYRAGSQGPCVLRS